MTAIQSDTLAVISDAKQIAAYADRKLPLASAHNGDEQEYASVPLCIIDAVYSIGVRYEGVQRVVERYCQRFGLPQVRRRKTELPSRQEQESVSDFCAKARSFGPERLAAEVFVNRQRTSSKNGILKAEAVLRFAEVLVVHGIEHLQDIPAATNIDAMEQDIRRIPGQASGISLRYFLMLAGSDEFIKPDRMVLRFLKEALDRSVSITEAQSLLRAACNNLRSKYPTLTPRQLDYEVWKRQREHASEYRRTTRWCRHGGR
jgi:hypothetical protein